MTCLLSLQQRNPTKQENSVILLCMFVSKCFSGFPEEIQIKMLSVINPKLSVSIRVSDQAEFYSITWLLCETESL